MPKPHTYSRTDVQAVIALCDAGMATKDIAAQKDMRYATVYRMIRGLYYADLKSEHYQPRQGSSKQPVLTNEDAKEIRRLHHDNGIHASNLASQYQISVSIIRQVLTGKTYKDAGGTIGFNKYTPYPDDLVLRVRQLYQDGMPVYAIADEIANDTISPIDTIVQVRHMLTKDLWSVDIPPVDAIARVTNPSKVKLPPSEREAIRQYYNSSNVQMTDIAKAYGVSLSYISLIISGKR